MTTRITWRRVSETRITVSAKPAFDPATSHFCPSFHSLSLEQTHPGGVRHCKDGGSELQPMRTTENLTWVFLVVVYPSLESEEDNPVFKSRSKKRKSSDDTPYNPTGKTPAPPRARRERLY